jgi:acetyl esterase/lipase
MGEKPKKRWYRRPAVMVPLAFLTAGLIAAVIWFVNPWPAALLIRAIFEDGGTKTEAEMVPYVPEGQVDSRLNLTYTTAGPDIPFDVYTPKGNTEQLPTVVWIHGGAWISGSKENVDPYVQILASHGYTTVALDYTVAPEATYPTALNQLNGALGYLVDNARDLNIDPDRIIVAGDSAGSNLTSQLAVLTTSSDYAELLGIEPALQPDQLDAVILNCGIYDVSGIPDAPGLGGWGFRIALWSYIGAKDWSVQPGGQEMSTLDYVTDSFPTTWISGGNGDPLTKTQSMPLADKLTGLGVDVETVFYPEDHEPSLPHEYQFKLDFADAQSALDSTIAFLEKVTAE